MFTHVSEVCFHVERKTMHGATAAETHADGTNFPWLMSSNAYPHTWIIGKAANIVQTKLGE